MPGVEALAAEAARQLSICNACRYCEGYCAVFPALERRAAFSLGDTVYLANLCHDCRACYQACMYAPPHELAIDIPALLSRVRAATHHRSGAARWLQGSRSAALATALGLVLTVALVLALGRAGAVFGAHPGAGGFYAVVPYLGMLLPALAAGLLVVALWAGGGAAIWREAGGTRREALSPRVWVRALADAVRLVYLGGGGPGCYYPDLERPTSERRAEHQAVFWGFAAALGSTIAAGVEQDVLGIQPPYPVLSIPVVLGTLGGLAMIAGAAGLLAAKLRAPRFLAAGELLDLDFAFLWLLILVNLSGLALLGLRSTSLLGPFLIAHLAFLFGLYATAPYGKFAHAAYRLTALALNRAEAAREAARA